MINDRSPPRGTTTISSALNYGDDVPHGPPLDAYPLSVAEGREAFLERLVAIGEVGVFEAVAHVWASLLPPAAGRCTLMGWRAGTGGSGKDALRKVLTAYVEEWLGGELAPLPAVTDFDSFDRWHLAVMALWAAERDREAATVKKYAAILNAEDPVNAPTSTSATLLKGPWRANGEPRAASASRRKSRPSNRQWPPTPPSD